MALESCIEYLLLCKKRYKYSNIPKNGTIPKNCNTQALGKYCVTSLSSIILLKRQFRKLVLCKHSMGAEISKSCLA